MSIFSTLWKPLILREIPTNPIFQGRRRNDAALVYARILEGKKLAKNKIDCHDQSLAS